VGGLGCFLEGGGGRYVWLGGFVGGLAGGGIRVAILRRR